MAKEEPNSYPFSCRIIDEEPRDNQPKALSNCMAQYLVAYANVELVFD